jgi:FkbM family methyltransferase
MVCLDIGANFGEVASHMARLVGRDGAVHAFEPAPSQFARLCAHAKRNGQSIQCHNLAVSDHCGSTQMAVPTEAAQNQGLGTIVASALPSGYALASVQLTTLDEFARRQRLARLDFIKLDIQGAEPLAIKGGLQTIAKFMPLIASEVSPPDLTALGYTSRQYCDMLTGLGYVVHTLTRRGAGRQIPVIHDAFAATNVLFVPPPQ